MMDDDDDGQDNDEMINGWGVIVVDVDVDGDDARVER
jgi:hypothetical protein